MRIWFGRCGPLGFADPPHGVGDVAGFVATSGRFCSLPALATHQGTDYFGDCALTMNTVAAPEPLAPLVSVVIASRDRPLPLQQLLDDLFEQDIGLERFEVVVVDDGSEPPLEPVFPNLRSLRTPGVERCHARNRGAELARAPWVLFLDDDVRLGPAFLAHHLAGQSTWPGSLIIGKVALPLEWDESPFGRWRRKLEASNFPATAGPHDFAGFCTAQNMAVPREKFLDMGGFDPRMVIVEDQELGLRWLEQGGQVCYLPEAVAVHHDPNRDFTAFCGRLEHGYRCTASTQRNMPTCRRTKDGKR